MHARFSHLMVSTAVALTLAFSGADALAKKKHAQSEMEQLLHELEVQGKSLQKQQKALKEQENKLNGQISSFLALKAKVEKMTGKKVAAAEPQESTYSNSAGVPAPQVPMHGDIPREVGTDRKPAQPEKPPEVAKYIEEGGVLLPKGKLSITPGLEYDHSGAVNVAIQGFSIIPALNIGAFEITKVSQDVLLGTVEARLGVTNRFEVDMKVPYLYSTQSTLGRPVGVGASTDTLTNINGHGIGDIEVGAHYQINKGQDNWPFFIANLRFKSNTGEGPFEIPIDNLGQATRLPSGSGFNAVQPSVTAIYASDPVVFYANLGYTHSFERSFGNNYGRIEPGDAINGSFGMSTSLNDATSLSLGFSHSMVFDTKQNGHGLPGSQYLQVGSVDVGWSYTLNDRVSLNLNASIGVTDDAPGDRITLRVPVSFDVF